jgi:Glycosyltransferase family 92
VVAICAIAKNEGPYLAEWVGYHHLIGFDPILVYNHESTDSSADVLDRLHERGMVEPTQWTSPPNQKPQWLAYEDGLCRLRDRADWIAFIDLDEFVVLLRHDTVQAFLDEFGSGEAIAINWKMFGSAGHRRHGPGLVMERFTRCAERRFHGNKSVKTLARPRAIEKPMVHTCIFRDGVSYQTVTGEEMPPGAGKSRRISHDIIRLNHYFTRSWEEWQAKAARGRGAKQPDHPKKHRTEQEFLNNDRNEREDREILVHAPRVKQLLATLNGT